MICNGLILSSSLGCQCQKMNIDTTFKIKKLPPSQNSHQKFRSEKSQAEAVSMSKAQSVFDYTDESQGARLAKKAKDSPFMIFGIMGLMGVCGYGAYAYKKRGKMSTSVFLMQLRVAAQGTVVSALTIGLAYSLVRDHLLKDDKKD